MNLCHFEHTEGSKAPPRTVTNCGLAAQFIQTANYCKKSIFENLKVHTDGIPRLHKLRKSCLLWYVYNKPLALVYDINKRIRYVYVLSRHDLCNTYVIEPSFEACIIAK